MKKITIHSQKHGKRVVLVDDQDFKWLSQYTWCLMVSKRITYARTSKKVTRGTREKPGIQKTIFMHRLILGLGEGDKRQGDHKDHNGLNNQRSNLRIASRGENMRSQRTPTNNTTGYKGVSAATPSGKFRAMIARDSKVIFLGSFDSALAAALAYDVAALENHGEFATLNFPK